MRELAAALGVVCGLAAACGGSSGNASTSHNTAASAATRAALTHTVTLNDGERLDPPPAGAVPKMTAVAAWRAFSAGNHAKNEKDLPPGARAYLASFTSSGDIQRRLVYGIRIPGCHPIYTLTPPTPYPTDCVGWQILDANTAVDLDLAWQGLLSG